MKLSLRSQVYAFFVVLLVVSTFNFSLMIWMENQSIKDFQRVNSAKQLLLLSKSLQGHIKDAETGQRGYIITNNVEYLEPYFIGVRHTSETFDLLKVKTEDSETLSKSINDLEKLVNSKFDELYESIELQRIGNSKAAVALVQSNLGKNIMDDIRLKIDQFEIIIQQQITFRNRELYALLQRIKAIFIAESVVFVAIMLILGWIVNVNLIKPISILTNAVNRFEMHKSFSPIKVKDKNELGRLARAFNLMAAEVVSSAKLLHSDLESATKEKNKALLQSFLDPMTELFNRRYMELEAEKLISSSKR